MRRRVVAFVPDLMDRSKFGSGPDRPTFVLKVADLGATPADLVFVDLSRAGALEAAAACQGRVIGFASHVDDATLERASAAGVEAYPRSVFFRRLAGWLAEAD